MIRLTAAAVILVASPVLAAGPAADVPTTMQKVETHELIRSVSGKSVGGANPEHEAILASCSAMKFETSVEVGSGDDKHLTKIKLCSRDGETKEQWIVSLTDAIVKIKANSELAPDSRDRLVVAIEAEIARLKS